VAQLHAAALAEDASVFAYDEVYDSLKESEKPKREAQKERKSRYIEGLLDKAKERNREQDIIYERQCVPSSTLTCSYSICRSN
jgi:coiled-coil domain-containing protein 55